MALLPSAQRQFLVKIDGLTDYWATRSGGEIEATVTKVWNGGRLTPDTLAGPALPSNIRIGRPYQADRDDAVLRMARRLAGRWRTTVTEQPTDENLTPVGQPTVYARALLTKVTPYDVDAASSEPGRFELEFAIDTIA